MTLFQKSLDVVLNARPAAAKFDAEVVEKKYPLSIKLSAVATRSLVK